MSGLAVFSGECFEGVIGTPAGFADMFGEPLHVGDIVQTFTVKLAENGDGEWLDTMGDLLTVVVNNPNRGAPFVMGIASIPMDEPGRWRVKLVKSHKDVIEGEHWPEYGFNYRAAPEVSEPQP